MSRLSTFIQLLLIGILMMPLGLDAQVLSFCEDFESLTPGLRFGRSTNLEPGSTVLQDETFRFGLEAFVYPDGTTGFDDVLVTREDMLGLDTTGNIGLWPSNINLKVDLLDTNLVSNQLCFDFAYGGGDINFSVNDGFLIVVDNLEELRFYDDTEIVPGVFFSINIDSTNVPRGTICLKGQLSQLVIGGQELFIDNLCVTYEDADPVCSIKNLKVEPYGCTPNDVFYLDYKFEFDGDHSKEYFVLVNNQNFGPFPFVQDTFPPLGPIQSFGDSIFFVQIYDAEKRFCFVETQFTYECNNLCPISSANATITQCLPNGNYDILVKADFAEIYRDAPVEIYVDNQSVGTFRSGSFPIQLENIPVFTEATTFEVKVCPLFNVGPGVECCKSIVLNKFQCPTVCPFEGVDAKILACLPNGNFDIAISVNYTDSSFGSPFQVLVDGNNLGVFQGDLAPIVLEDVPVYTDALDFTVVVCPASITTDSILNYNCCVSKTLYKDDCEPVETDCIGFESLPQESYGGDQNPPGSEIFSIQDISFKLNPLQNLDWSTSYEKLSVVPQASIPNFSTADEQVLLHQGISSIIGFQNYDQAVEEVSIDFYYERGHLNLGANGGQIHIIPFLAPGDYDLGNGVSVKIDITNSSGGMGKMTFSGGNIQALLLGGEFLAIDNLCINPEEKRCELGELHLTASPCQDDGSFYINLDFKYENTSDYFIVTENGNSLSRYAYEELPVKLGPFRTPYEAGAVFTVYDSEKGCEQIATFGPYFCIPECDIWSATIGDIECNLSDYTYNATLKIEGQEIGDLITVQTKSGYFRDFRYSGEAIRLTDIPLTDRYYDGLEVCGGIQADSSASCCKSIEYDIPCKPICTIEEVKVFDIECDRSAGVYHMSIKIDGSNFGDFLSLSTKSGFLYRFTYEGEAVRIRNIPLTNQGYDGFTLCGGLQPNDAFECCIDVSYELPCELECPITEVKVVDVECSEDSTYSFTVLVDPQFDSINSYYLRTNSGFEIKLDDVGPSFRVNNVPLPAGAYYEGLTICPIGEDSCCLETKFEIPCFDNPCTLKEVQIKDIRCTAGDSLYSLLLYFDDRTVASTDILTFVTKSGYETRFQLDTNYIVIDGIPNFGWGEDAFQICDTKLPNCCIELAYEIPCYNEPCALKDVLIKDIRCSADDSLYSLLLYFDDRTVASTDFLTFVTKSGYETRFQVDTNYVYLEGIPNWGRGEDAFQVCDPNFANCCFELAYDIPCDLNEECKIGELKAAATPCDERGVFYIELDFEHKNTSGGFSVYLNGSLRDTFRYSELPVKIGPIFPGIVPVEFYEVTVKDWNEDCKASTIVRACDYQGCNFESVKVNPIECEDGQFYTEVIVNASNPFGDGYLIFAEGELYGPYSYYSRERIILGPFDADGISTYDFLFVDQGDPSCFAYQEIGPIDCEETCLIENLVVDPLFCNEDGSYQVFIDFDAKNAENEFFDIFTASGMILGTYRVDELPIEVALNFPEDLEIQHLAVCINDTPDCCARTEFKLPPCEPTCEPLRFTASPSACDSNGLFYFDLKFDFDLTVIYPILIEVNGEFYDSTHIGGRDIEIGPFKSGEAYTITVIDVWRDCPSKLEIGVVDCEQDCGIEDLKIEVVDCNPNGSFDLYLDLKYEGDSNTVFSLFNSNGQVIKEFGLLDLPLEVDNVNIDGDYFGVCVAGTECCKRVFLAIPACPPCGISEAEARFIECDTFGRAFVGIKADWDLNRLDSYIITQGDIAYPFLEVTASGLVIIGPLGNNNEPEKLLITDAETGCEVGLEVGPFPCTVSDDVWPGDANLDNIANHLDLLSLGFAWGKEGPQRMLSTEDWTAVAADAWGARFYTGGPDVKHADCNGDGIIDEKDIAVLEANYGLTHGALIDAIELPNTDFDPPVFFEVPPKETLPDSGAFRLPIVLGTEDQPLNNLYGVAFTIEFDPKVIDPSSIELSYPTSWLGEEGVNLATIDYTFSSDGVIEVALTRTDQNEVSGFGPVAYFRGIRDDIIGRSQMDVKINHSMGVHNDGSLIPIKGLSSKVEFPETVPSYGLIDLKAGMRIYPNPASDRVFVRNIFEVPVDGLQILSADGRVIRPMERNTNQLDLSTLPDGLYIIRVDMGGHLIHKKLFKK